MNKVQICDAMMGSGKTTAAIKYMNEQTDRRFLFITPYLEECDRIKAKCKSRGFLAPWRSEKSKFENLHELLAEKKNLASTHAMMRKFNSETIRLIREGRYTLILDEVFDVLNVTDVADDDIQLLKDSGTISIASDGLVSWNLAKYNSGAFSEFKKLCEDRLVVASDDDVLVWQFPTSVFAAFDDVIVLTYQFDGQIQRAYFDINGIEYEYIYVRKLGDGQYEFTNLAQKAEKPNDYIDMIHIVDRPKLNAPGNSKTALSMSWSQREISNGGSMISKIRKTTENLRRNIWKADDGCTLWTCAKDSKAFFETDRLNDKNFLAWNYRATNAYREKKYLYYLHNVYLHPSILLYLHQRGASLDESQYALSSLIQWIWRSAIRDGQEIWIYIPSARMRGLLKKWLGSELTQVEREAVYGKFRSAA